MADVLDSGPERVVRPRRRRGTVLVAVLLAVTAALLAVRSTGVRRPAAPAAGEGGVSVVVRPAPTPYPTGPFPPPPTFALDGDPGPGPAGLRLVVGGIAPGTVDAATGRFAALPGVSRRHGEAVEVEHRAGTTTALVRSPDRARNRGVLLAGGRVVPLGVVRDLLPLRDGTVLAQSCGAPGTGCEISARDTTGAVRWRRSVPREVDLVRDTPYGLLVRAYEASAGGVVRLEDARTGELRRVIGRTYDVLAADDRQVAFQPANCESDCPLQLADLARGGVRYVAAGAGRPATAAFSPDGRRLAIGYTGLFPQDSSTAVDRGGYALVLELVGEPARRRVPGLTTGLASAPVPVWAPDGRLVLAVGDAAGAGRLVAWRLGAPRLTVLGARLAGFSGVPGSVAAY